MVPVLDQDKIPLMPCSEKRARKLMEKGEAKPYWQKGIFCIKLLKEPSNRKMQPIALGVDPGSKREGYTVATEKTVVLNIISDTPDWVKNHVETRRNLRRSRRQRKTPHRQCRLNRSSLRKNRIPPSTKSRWNAKLRILKFLLKIIPITIINVEDIKAKPLEGKKRWNKSFSPLEVGKNYFYDQIKQLGLQLILTEGYGTKSHRDKRNFFKSNNKLDFKWEAHNVDSHSLTEMVLKKEVKPYFGLWQINFLRYHRRQLHVQNPIKGSIRKPYGGTVSLGMSRGSIVKYKDKLYYLGGSSKGKVAIYSIITGKRIKQYVSKKDLSILTTNKWRTQFIPQLKKWDFLHKFQ